MKPRITSLHPRPIPDKSREQAIADLVNAKYRLIKVPGYTYIMEYNEAKGLWMRHHDQGKEYHYRVVDNDGWDTYWQDHREALAYYNSLPRLINRMFIKLRSPMVW